MAKKSADKNPKSKPRASIDKLTTISKPLIRGYLTKDSLEVALDLPLDSQPLKPTLAGKPKTLAEYMADKGRAMREHVGLPPMPALKPCNAPSDEDVCALAMCYCTPKEIKDIGSDDWIISSRAISKAMLKRKMLERALSGDSQMMTWLSKQHLGYREPKSDEQQSNTINIVTSDMPTILKDRIIEVNE